MDCKKIAQSRLTNKSLYKVDGIVFSFLIKADGGRNLISLKLSLELQASNVKIAEGILAFEWHFMYRELHEKTIAKHFIT